MLFQVDLPITRLTRQLKPLIIALSDRSEAISGLVSGIARHVKSHQVITMAQIGWQLPYLVCYRKTRKWKKCALSRGLQWFFTSRQSSCGIKCPGWGFGWGLWSMLDMVLNPRQKSTWALDIQLERLTLSCSNQLSTCRFNIQSQ